MAHRHGYRAVPGGGKDDPPLTGQRTSITGREAGEDATAQTALMARFSHDFRTPLNIIIGFTELLLDEVPGEINEEQRRGLTDILDSARRLLDMVNDIRI
ncbi:MAG: histidine kinase dimerization/phospho-acceptor domain-containing protein [Chloroflexota bacterium]